VVAILQGSVVTQTVLGGANYISSRLQISYGDVYVLKIMTTGWQ